MRIYALIWAFPMIITATGIIVELRSHNPEHFRTIMDLWWIFGLSFILFLGTVYFILKKKSYGVAFGLLVRSISHCLFCLWIFLIYPIYFIHYLGIYDGFTNKAMAISLVIAFIAGLGLLLPSLYLLLRLFLFNKNYVEGKQKDYA